MNNPEVTCLQLSYGRPRLSVEAVECFLRQTYTNKKLIIINTHSSPVYFNTSYDNIEVHNIKPPTHLSDVYRYGLQLIKSPHFCIWDDDDIFLPWHIADRVAKRLLTDEYNAIGHSKSFFSLGDVIQNVGGNTFVSQYLYDNNGILPDANISCWDVNWVNKPWKRGYVDFPCKPSYIYRWGTGENHIGGHADEAGQHGIYLRNIEEKHNLKFDFPWKPEWRRDYISDATLFLENMKKI
jgi:hypothetical protein